MFTLITEATKSQLKKGTILLKYPDEGELVDAVPDDYDKGNSREYQISSIDDEREHMRLNVPPSPTLVIDGQPLIIGPLLKSSSDMIRDRNWWIYTPNAS